MSKVLRSEKMLDNLASNQFCELSRDGANYIKERFDPYHDLPMKPVGYPDGYAGSTVARCIKKTVTVSATSGGGDAPATTWNLHIYDSPIEDPVLLKQSITGSKNNLFLQDSVPSDTMPYGGLMAQRSDTANWVYPATNQFLVGQLSLSNNDLKNVMRVVSSGWEVIDETAELYQQGTLTCYRQNQQQNSPSTYTKILTGTAVSESLQAIQTVSAKFVKFPPANTASAMLIPNTKQWKVREGAYVVTDYNSDELPMVEPAYVEPVLINDNAEVIQDQISIASPNFWMPGFVGAPAAITFTDSAVPPTKTLQFYPALPNRITPKNQSGIFLTGLNPQASITINKIWYVECAPAGEDEELLSLASQSPVDDPMALKIVATLRRNSPVAVKRRENYMGEWFVDGVKSLIGKVMPWLSNAQVVGNQVVKWIDAASTNDGYINPQSFVRGSVAAKVASEKQPKEQAIIVKPPPRPSRAAPLNKPLGRGKKTIIVTQPGTGKARRIPAPPNDRLQEKITFSPNNGGMFRRPAFRKTNIAYPPRRR